MSVSWRSLSLNSRLLEGAYVLVLSFIVGVSGWFLVFLNQDLLATGRFKFAFPLAATYLQLLVAYAILFCLGILIRTALFLLHFLQALPQYQRIPSYSSESSTEHEENGSTLELLPMDCAKRATIGLFPGVQEKIRRHAALTCLLTGKILFSNCSLAYSHYHNHELAEIMSVPILLSFTSNFDGDFAVPYLSSTLIAAGNIFFANMQRDVRLPWESVLCAVLSSLFGAAFYFVLHRTYFARRSHQQYMGDSSTCLKAQARHEFWMERISSSWELAHFVVLLSLLVLTPVVVGSGEAVSVWRNYLYVTDRPFLLLIVATGSLTCAALCAALLLVQVAGPVATAFVVVPRTAWQLWWLNQTQGMESARVFVGMIGCLWFYSSSSSSKS